MPERQEPNEEVLDRVRRRLARLVSRHLGERAVELGWITRAQLEEALSRQSEEARQGRYRMLGRILVEAGWLREEQVNTLLREQRTDRPAEVLDAMRLPDRCFGRYVLVREIGRGGVGEIWRAWDLELGRWVAVKLLRENSSEVARVRFVREAQAAGRLRHPNLVTVFDAGEFQGRPFLVMELLEGQPLSSPMEPKRAAEVLARVARALEEAHRQGIVHRDLKPANILLDERRGPVILDFGLAHLMDSPEVLTRTGAVLGTPCYMAPEQVRGQPNLIGPRTDVYALGAILYELLSGRPPHDGQSSHEVFLRILEEEPERLRAPRDLWTICQKALEKDPARRYASARALAEDLERFVEGRPIAARPPSVTYRVRKLVARHRGPVAFCVLVLSAGALAGYWIVSRRLEFNRAVSDAYAAYERGDWATAVSRGERALSIRADESLSRILSECRERIEAEKVRLEEAETFRQLQKSLEPLRMRIEETRRAFYIPGADIEATLQDLRASLETLAGQKRFERYAELWSTAGQGWYVAGDPKCSEQMLRKALELGSRDGRVSFTLGKIYFEESVESLLRVSDEDSHRQQERFGAARKGALEHLERAAKLGIGSEGLERELVGVYTELARGDKAASERLCQEALSRYGLAAGAEEFWVGLALLRSGERRLEALEEALKRRPHYPWALFLSGTQKYVLGRFHEAKKDLDRAIRLQPGFAPAYMNRGNVLRELGDLRAALADFETSARLRPEDPDKHFNVGTTLMALGDLEGSAAAYRRSLQLAPSDLRVRCHYARVLALKGDQEGARAEMERLKGWTPRTANQYALRGDLRACLGDVEGALADLARAVELDPEFADGYLTRGRLKRERGDYEGAIEELSRALEVNPKFAVAHIERGSARLQLGRIGEALADYDRAIELDPKLALAYYNRSVVHFSVRRDAEAALRDLNRAIELQPGYVNAHLNRGMVKEAVGDLQGALADYTRVLELDPKMAKAYSNRGNVRRRMGDWRGGLEDLTRAIGLDPSLPEAYCNRALVHLDAAEREEGGGQRHLLDARGDLTRCLEVAPAAWPHRREIERLLREVSRRLSEY